MSTTIVFELLLTEIDHKNTNEKIFEEITQNILLKPYSMIAKLIETAIIRKEKLNNSQIKGLDFLKEAFINLINAKYKLYRFLLSKEYKIKKVLEHINSELKKM